MVLRRLALILICLTVGIAGAGCSSGRRLLREEIPLYPNQKYMEVVRPSAVIGVVLAPQEGIVYDTLEKRLYPRLVQGTVPQVIAFDSTGVTIDVENQTVAATAEDGSLFKQDFVNLLYLQVKETDLARQFISPLDLSCDREEAESNPRNKIKRGSSPCWDVVEFNKTGGWYDSTSRAIVGLTNRGTRVSIGVDEILYARYWKRDKHKTYRSVVAALMLFAFGNGAFHIWDGY